MATLQHFGIKGMRWGVRRSVNELRENLKPSADAIAAGKAKGKAKIGGVEALSNKEIQTAITRMNLERQYVDILGNDSFKGRAKKWMANFMRDVAKDTLVSYVGRGGRGGGGSSSSPGRSYVPTINGELVGPKRRAIGS